MHQQVLPVFKFWILSKLAHGTMSPAANSRAGLVYYTTGTGAGLDGSAHSHPIDMRVTYLDLILCVKN